MKQDDLQEALYLLLAQQRGEIKYFGHVKSDTNKKLKKLQVKLKFSGKDRRNA